MVFKKCIIFILFVAVQVTCEKGIPLSVPVTRTDGAWSAWSPIKCNVSCGGGVGIRARQCNNPAPSQYGKHCSGPSSMRFHCNTHKCGRPSPIVAERIIHNINTIRREIVQDIRKGGIHLDCQGRILLDTSATTVWVHNELEFTYNNTHLPFYMTMLVFRPISVFLVVMGYYPSIYGLLEGVQVLKNGSLYLSGDNKHQSGLWVCAIRLAEKETSIVSVATVIFRPTESESENFLNHSSGVLRCNAFPLSDITPEYLRQVWYHNERVHTVNTIIKDTLFLNITHDHAGSWKCVIKNVNTDVQYTTAQYEVRVYNNLRDLVWNDIKIMLYYPPENILISIFCVGLITIVFINLGFCDPILEWYVKTFKEDI